MNNICYESFCEKFDKINKQTFVIRTVEQDKVIATASIFIEGKFSCNAGHIEDVVVDEEYQKKGFGKKLTEYCKQYAFENGCYKVILNCSKENIEFYEKCGFQQKNFEMSYYKNK
jgi:glucosamine-phosphate N-acetyltransferase